MEATSAAPQSGEPEATARANPLWEQSGAERTRARCRRGPSLRADGGWVSGRAGCSEGRGAGWAGTERSVLGRRAPLRPAPSRSRAAARAHARTEARAGLPCQPMGGEGGGGARRLGGKHGHVTAAPPPSPGKQVGGRPARGPLRRLPPCGGRGPRARPASAPHSNSQPPQRSSCAGYSGGDCRARPCARDSASGASFSPSVKWATNSPCRD